MKQKEIMKKPIISFGVEKAIKLGFLNKNLYDFKNDHIIESSKKKINDYQYYINKNIVLFVTLVKNGIQKYTINKDTFFTHSGIKESQDE